MHCHCDAGQGPPLQLWSIFSRHNRTARSSSSTLDVTDQSVAQSGDRSPGHLWLCICEISRQRLHGFTDDFEASGKGPFQNWIRKKISLIQLISGRQQIGGFVKDMEQQAHASRATSRASPRIEAARCLLRPSVVTRSTRLTRSNSR